MHEMLKCLWCDSAHPFTASCSAGLLSHIARMHPGAELDDRHVRQMQFHNKACCVMCGVLRGRQVRQ
eukprot:3929674-Karenia_brevis.AAC.1